MKKGSQNRKKKKDLQADPLMDKVNRKLNKYIMLFYFAGVAAYFIWGLIGTKNKNEN